MLDVCKSWELEKDKRDTWLCMIRFQHRGTKYSQISILGVRALIQPRVSIIPLIPE